jgi:long-chain acyl-CoA synthetase
VPLNTRWAIAENEYALKDSGPKILLVDENFAGQIPELSRRFRLEAIVYIGEGALPDGTIAYETLVEAADPIEDRSGSYNDLLGIFYTGGTTGFPKGVMLSHSNVVYESVVWIYSLNFSEDTVYLHSAALFHLAGASPMVALTLVGGTHVTIPKFEPELAMTTIAREKVNYCLFVPTMLNMMLNHAAFGQYDLSSVRDCEYGASPMPDALLVDLMKKLPSWRFHQGYGLTECAALACLLPWKYHALEGPIAQKRKSAGRAAAGVEIRIVDNTTGEELPRTAVGEIAIRGAGVMLGYWRKPEETERALRNGWLHTGDGAWMDEDGFVYIVDRVKDMIISGGENVYSGEVENAIYQHGGVRECAVIAVPDEKWGEAVHAIVVPKDGQQRAGGCHRALPDADRRLQMPAHGRIATGAAAADRQRKDHEIKPSRRKVARPRTLGQLDESQRCAVPRSLVWNPESGSEDCRACNRRCHDAPPADAISLRRNRKSCRG